MLGTRSVRKIYAVLASIGVIGSLTVVSSLSPVRAGAAPSVTVGPLDNTTNSSSNFDVDGKWIGDGAISVPITFSGFDTASTLFVTISAPDGGAVTINATGIGASISRAYGYGRWTDMAELSFSGSRAEIATLLADKVTYVPPSNGGTYGVKVTITEYTAGVYFNPVNDHYYKPITGGSDISWTSAKTAAAASTFNGLTGYLATITSRSENDFIRNYIGTQDLWIGATDKDTEGTWKWDTGPEAGTSFWTGQGSGGSQVSSRFSYWKQDEPNDAGGTEDYAVTNYGEVNGRWNDFPNAKTGVKSYLIEYGGAGSYTGLFAEETASVVASSPFSIGTMSGATFTEEEIVWSSSTTKSFAINVARFGAATSTNYTATLTLNGSGLGTLTMPTTTGLTLNTGYSSFTAQTAIGFTGTKANVIAALKDLRWNTPASRGDLEIQVALGETDTDYYLNPSNGHYYKLVSGGSNITWSFARSLATITSYKGMQGYMVTLATSEENEFVKTKIAAEGVWISASDNETYVNESSIIQRSSTEGRWTWTSGPEAGTQFWQGTSGGSALTGQYASWRSGEPNNSSDSCGLFQSCNFRDEDYAYTNASGALGKWNDVYNGSGIKKYIIEYGGLPNEASTAKSAVAVVGLGRVPDAPTGVSAASNAPRAATVSWTAPVDTGNRPILSHTAMAYDASGDPLTGKVCTSASAAATSCTITGITEAVAKFKVVANNVVGSGTASDFSSDVNIQDNGEPDPPIRVKAGVSGTTVTVSWTAPTDTGLSAITSYTATASPDGATCSATAPDTSCTFNSLTNGTEYTFTVTATNTQGASPESDPSAAVTVGTDTTAPSSPTDILASVAADGTITVSFTPGAEGSTPVTEYVVYAYDSNGDIVGSCTAIAPATSCAILGLPAGDYTFKVVAYNANGGSAPSAPSAEVDPTSQTSAPGTPTGVTTTVTTNGTIRVSFTAPTSIGTSAILWYDIKVYSAGGSVVDTCRVTAPTTTCDISGLSTGSAYTFTVTAVNSNGASDPSSETGEITPTTTTSTTGGGSGGSGGSGLSGPDDVVASIVLDANIGDSFRTRNVPVVINMSGLDPATDVVGIVYSTPKLFGRADVGASGSVSKTFRLPSNLEGGDHRIEIRAAAEDGTAMLWQVNFTLDSKGRLVSKSAVKTFLPQTGSSSSSNGLLALYLMLIGAMLVTCSRRLNVARRRTSN